MRRLRALWASHATGLLNWDVIDTALRDKDPHVRGWAIQLALEQPAKELIRIDQLVKLAEKEESPVVRLYLASALRKLDYGDCESILAHLLKFDDGKDPNLPLMYWYALEPLAGNVDHREGALKLAEEATMPQLLAFTVRRIASDADPESLGLIITRLGEKGVDNAVVLRELRNALKGRPQVKMPTAWPAAFAKLAAHNNAEVRNHAAALAVTFGDARAFDEMRRLVTTATADAATRQSALAALLAAKDKQLVPALHQLLGDSDMRGAALQGLAGYDDLQTPAAILSIYAKLDAAEKRDALATLASRTPYGRRCSRRWRTRKSRRRTCRRNRCASCATSGIGRSTNRIAEVWGVVRDTPAERAKEIARYREMVTDPAKPPADVALGRAIYAKTCQQCHVLFGVGGKVGPDITGANRANLGYLLENILDPSAVIPKEYAATIIETKAGRTVTGIVKGETPAALTVVTANETLTIPLGEIETRLPTKVSMMPDDLLKPMSDHEVRSSHRVPAEPRADAHPGHGRQRQGPVQRQGPDRLGRRSEAVARPQRRDRRQEPGPRSTTVPAKPDGRRRLQAKRQGQAGARIRKIAASSSAARRLTAMRSRATRPTSAPAGGASCMRRMAVASC